jgi:dephospho-CoA kinase
MMRPFCIGLTGGIGSGKSSVTDIFSGFGVAVIDADMISHEVVQAGQPALQTIAEAFGADVIGEDGQLRRAHLRSLIFDDLPARRQLEAIIHPLVHSEIARRVNQVTFPYCIVSSPLLLESSSAYDIDRILVVDAPEPLQIERASRRDKSQQEEIKKIIASQISRQARLDAADDVIVNDKDLYYLEEQVKTLHKKYLEIAASEIARCS